MNVSKYKPEFCRQLIQHMEVGYSFESFSSNANVCRDTLYEWCKVHKEFAAAKKSGAGKSLKFWETLGVNLAAGKLRGGNAAIWIFTMKNRFGWKDSREITGKDGEDLTIKLTVKDYTRKAPPQGPQQQKQDDET